MPTSYTYPLPTEQSALWSLPIQESPFVPRDAMIGVNGVLLVHPLDVIRIRYPHGEQRTRAILAYLDRVTAAKVAQLTRKLDREMETPHAAPGHP